MKLTCHSCEIEIYLGLLDEISTRKLPGCSFAIITDDVVKPLYGNKLLQILLESNRRAVLFSFSSGEEYKTRETKEFLENALFESDFGKDACIIALGGGVVMDVAGFVAATYCRGISLVMIPTSFLGMVDACIGGKNGVNIPYGKNLVGSIYQPKQVFIDPVTLQTLPKKEWVNGFVEIIKHSLIADVSLFEELEKQDSFFSLEQAIFKSCSIKRFIVEEDELEKGKRHLLNFGHTIGHALETLTQYALSHGEAVAVGMLVEGYLSVLLGFLSKSSLDRIQRILLSYGAPLQIPQKFSFEEFRVALKLDKKSINCSPRFVLIEDIGKPLSFHGKYCDFVKEELVREAIMWMNYDLCGY